MRVLTNIGTGIRSIISMDMQSGMINKVAITPANVTDAQGLKNICPTQGAIYPDKGYCTSPASQAAARKGCYLEAIKKNNMKGKNTDQDHWYSKIRAPYERVFSNTSKKARYKGIVKNHFAAFIKLYALISNAYWVSTGHVLWLRQDNFILLDVIYLKKSLKGNISLLKRVLIFYGIQKL